MMSDLTIRGYSEQVWLFCTFAYRYSEGDLPNRSLNWEETYLGKGTFAMEKPEPSGSVFQYQVYLVVRQAMLLLGKYFKLLPVEAVQAILCAELINLNEPGIYHLNDPAAFLVNQRKIDL